LVVLARLLVPAKDGLTLAKIASDLSKLDVERFSAERIALELEDFCARKEVESITQPARLSATTPVVKKRVSMKPPRVPKPPAYRLTAAGQEVVLRALGLQKPPPKATWKIILDKHLLRVAIDLAPEASLPITVPALAAYLICRQFNLGVPKNSKLPDVIAATVCQRLGHPGVSSYKILEARVLEGIMGVTGLTPKNATEQFIRKQLDSKQGKIDEIRASSLRRWLADGISVAPEKDVAHRITATVNSTDSVKTGNGDELLLADFARRAVDAARRSDSGRFGENKAFISHAWKTYCADGDGQPHLGLSQFKQQLLRANTAGLLELSRADLVALMDPDDVRQSETQYLNTSFHFILLERGRP
jgi:hypothetical protein